MIGPIRVFVSRWIWGDALDPEHEQFLRKMSALERDALETTALTEDLEARIEILEAEHALEHGHDGVS
jgi:hypothetical protein